MPHLVNPGGRIVAIDDEKELQKLLDKKGFRIATEEEAESYINIRIERIKQQKLTKELGETVPDIYLATVVGRKNGYGIASVTLIKELEDIGVKVSRSQLGQKIGVLFHNPYSVFRLGTPYRIIYTMFESTKIPDDWIEYLNGADKVLVPSKWCADVFAKSGIETKVVPLGYNHRIFQYKERENKRVAHAPFKFLHYNAYNLRKGFLELVNAFTKEFDPSEPVKLILKTTLKQPPFPFPPSRYPNIEVIQGEVSDDKLADLCHECDSFVFPSRGEGFGITPLEAMATGMPTIVPNAHGISEYFDKEYMYEVKVKEECPAVYSRYKDVDVGKMVVCDTDDLRRQMRYVYEHQEEALNKGKRASEYVKNWTFEKTAIKLKSIFDKVMSQPIDEQALRDELKLERV
jgi:glycosyltransferase involved in cell wall biosynthesis